jgi:hypothetical protein
VIALQEAINRFVAAHNRDPKPFVWKTDPKAIIAAPKEGAKRWIRSTSCREYRPERARLLLAAC